MIFSAERTFLAILLSGVILPVALQGQEERLYFRHFDSAETSTLFVSGRTMERTKHLVGLCLPHEEASGKSWNVVVEVDTTGTLARLETRPGKRRNEIRVRFPENIAQWKGDREQMCDLVAWCILAKMGRGPGKTPKIRSHWIVRALARRLIAEETVPSRQLFVRSYPMSYALAAHGMFASFDSVLISPPEGTPPYLCALADEYASLLLDICQRAGLLQGGLAEKLLTAELEGSGDESLSFFAAVAEVSFPSRSQAAVVSEADEGKNFFLAWFEGNAEHILLTFFAPVSAAQFEIIYRKNAWIRMIDPKTHEVRRIAIHALSKEKTAPEEAELKETIHRLSLLKAVTPPCLQESLSGVRQALDRIRTRGMEHAEEAEEAERRLIRETSRLCGIERYLKKVQERQIVPVVRLEASLRAVREFRFRKQSETGIDRLLDQWDDYR